MNEFIIEESCYVDPKTLIFNMFCVNKLTLYEITNKVSRFHKNTFKFFKILKKILTFFLKILLDSKNFKTKKFHQVITLHSFTSLLDTVNSIPVIDFSLSFISNAINIFPPSSLPVYRKRKSNVVFFIKKCVYQSILRK
jgi:hypothetical protein